jgi:hypothetical protein
MSLAKFIIAFCLSYAILCIPVSRQPLFSHLHQWTTPYAQEFMSYLKDASKRGWEHTKKLFSNSTPQMQDSVHSTFSAPQKEIYRSPAIIVEDNGEVLDTYTREEKELLTKILSKEK